MQDVFCELVPVLKDHLCYETALSDPQKHINSFTVILLLRDHQS